MQDLEVVGRGGEIKHTKISEASYVNSLDTYARMMALTRQDMIDDDLGAFSEIPEGFGDISARTLEKSVWTRFLDNTSGFLSVTPTGYRQNLLAAGAGSALSVTSLEEAKVLFAQQQDEDGNPIMVSPSVLLSGETVAETANSLLNKTTIEVVGDGSGSDFRTAEQFRGRFRPVSTPWLGTPAGLTGSSDTAWYLIGKSSIYAPIEVAFLNGQAGPTIASDDTDFNTLGRQWRVFFDWGVAKFEPRMVVGSPGA